jgi:hypothetical protein
MDLKGRITLNPAALTGNALIAGTEFRFSSSWTCRRPAGRTSKSSKITASS